MKRATRKATARDRLKPQNTRLPFIEHLHELRKRLFYVAVSVGIWGAGAYFIQQKIVAALLRPAHNQQFIYTSVGGGIDFLFRVCIYTGVACSIPVIVFQILKYLEPLIKKDAIRFIAWGSAVSGVLALAGIAFGYFVGLPAALHFLLHQFTTDQIHPLVTIQSYMGFVTLYMLGSALLFQIPLLLVLINRIKPLKPQKLIKSERWVILISFVMGGIMNPSPRIQDQILLAGPMIAAYQVGIIIIWLTNRGTRRPARVVGLLQKDAEARAARQAKFAQARAVQAQHATAVQPAKTSMAPKSAVRPSAVPTAVTPIAAKTQLAVPATVARRPGPQRDISRPRGYSNSFAARRIIGA